MIQVTFTEQEANAFLQLADVAVKAGGIQVAETAVVLTKKVGAAFAAAKQAAEVKEDEKAEGKAE